MYYVHVDARVSVRVLESARVVCACERAGCHMGARVVCACEHVSASEGATHVWFVWLILYQYYIPTHVVSTSTELMRIEVFRIKVY